GLFLGKPIGIFLFSRVAIALGVADRPEDATWAQLFGVAILGGIGFTMSLFIGTLAFTDPILAAEVRIGVLVGSLASASVGFQLLRRLAEIEEIKRQTRDTARY
ncbi:Na+/H+ antiporter NhaA, partial [Microbacteriaceae bacterium K1510]|nr:Na+/H+ antiporter NhaA [Microbacteriaceae bacterium K1510]